MAVLGLDSSTSLVSLGLTEPDRILGEFTFYGVRRQIAGLIPWLNYLLEESGKKPADLEAVACVVGPGSFSGLRIGLATVQGLALALGIPVVELCSLDVLATGVPLIETCAVVMHSHGDNYFYAHYRNGGRQGDIAVATLANISEELPESTPIVFPNAPPVPQWPCAHPKIRAVPVAVSGIKVAQMGEILFRQGGSISPLLLAPKYFRGSFAEGKKYAGKTVP